MLNLSEYRRKPQRLADFLPWAALVAPGIVLNKDGLFQRTARFRGPDLESGTPAELVSATARLNNALRRLGSGWAIFVEASRVPAQNYPRSRFPDAVSALVDHERRVQFEEEGAHFESAYYLTFVWMPPAENSSRAEGWLYEGKSHEAVDARKHLESFADRTGRILQLVESFVPEATWLGAESTLTYLHACVSTKRQSVRVPETPFYLDALLADQPLTGGLEPSLGSHHLRTLTIIGFPTVTFPGILDELNRLAFSYRWSTRAIMLDKTDATRLLTKIRRQWFAKRKSIAAILKEVMTNEASTLLDTDAANRAADADLALQELGSDEMGQAYVTATVTVWDEDASAAAEKLRLVEKVIQGRDFTCITETVNAIEAWLGSLPGHVYANVRQPPISTLNLAHMIPLSAIWAGPERDDHLEAPPLFLPRTEGSTPFRFSLHVGDVGHTLIIGPTGAGKSVLLALMALQFRRYDGAQIFAFDFGGSIRAAALAMGGDWHDLGGALSADIQVFETEGLIGMSAAPAILSYLFHRIEGRLDGRPTLLVIDEGWLALVGIANAENEPSWSNGDVPSEHAIRGFQGVTLLLDSAQKTAAILTDVFGFREVAREGSTIRFTAAGDAKGSVVDIHEAAGVPRRHQGRGSVHHIAFRDHARQPTDQNDRKYFRSIYFREPGGVLFEIATDIPGFAVDEPVEALGQHSKLPEFLESRRKEIEGLLPVLGTAG